MIAFKHIDYFVYFDENDLAVLESGKELTGQIQNHTDYEPFTTGLKSLDELWKLKRKKKDTLVFQNEAMLAVVHMSELRPTQHAIFFKNDWFVDVIGKITAGHGESATIRWGADKITILAGDGSEARKFKMLYGK